MCHFLFGQGSPRGPYFFFFFLLFLSFFALSFFLSFFLAIILGLKFVNNKVILTKIYPNSKSTAWLPSRHVFEFSTTAPAGLCRKGHCKD